MVEYHIQNFKYYLPKAEIKDCNFMVDGKSFFDRPINSDFKTYEYIRLMLLVKEMIR